MQRHIETLNIDTYRGIEHLSIKNIGGVNILVGNNNSGKTSVLEALQIINEPYDFANIVKVSRQRDKYAYPWMIRSPRLYYDSFVNIFNRGISRDKMSVSLNSLTRHGENSVQIYGYISKTLPSPKDISPRMANEIVDEVDCFMGKHEWGYGSACDVESVAYHVYTRLSAKRSYKAPPVQFLSTVDHILLNSFLQIIRDKSLTTDVVTILQLFDDNIIDLRSIPGDSNRNISMIDHKRLGYMPLTTYGDGIRKIIALANAIARAKGGMVLIDEIETGIHTKAMDKVFRFIIDACREYGVQLFATTHSLEVLEKILSVTDVLDETRVITLYKNEDKTVARVLEGRKAIEVKDELGLELRS